MSNSKFTLLRLCEDKVVLQRGIQSRSSSLRQKNERFWEQPFWNNKGNNRILPIQFHCTVFIYCARLKWFLPECLVFRPLVEENKDSGNKIAWNLSKVVFFCLFRYHILFVTGAMKVRVPQLVVFLVFWCLAGFFIQLHARLVNRSPAKSFRLLHRPRKGCWPALSQVLKL